jgi:hypothetical protein
MVERANKEVNRHLRALVNEKRVKDIWSEVLPLIQKIYNTSDCSCIGVSPWRLIFGNAIDLERRIIAPDADSKDNSTSCKQTLISATKYLDNCFAAQEALIRAARRIQEETASRNAGKKVSRTDACLEIGGYVLLREPAGPEDKISYPNTGPWLVESIKGNDVTLRNLVYDNIRHINITQITPFVYDAEITDPYVEAMKDKQEYRVQEIVDIENVNGLRSLIRVKVRWTGYGPEEDSWVSWKDIRENVQLHKYLRDNGLGRLIRHRTKQIK